MLTPKTKFSRLVLPRATAGSTDEPSNAEAGTLSFDPDLDEVRIKTSTGWASLVSQAGSLYHYKADTSATSGDPGSGNIRWNNATQASATTLLISHLDDDGNDIDVFLGLIASGNTIVVQDRNDSGVYQTWSVSGSPSHPGDYWSVPVTLIASAGGNLPNNHQIIVVTEGGGGGGGTGDLTEVAVSGTGILVASGTGPIPSLSLDFGTTAGKVADGAHVSNTSNPHSVTKAQVGLGSVTNDPQWASTLSAQISALTAKTTLVAADVIPIEDSAASDAKKKVTASDLASYVATTYGARNPYLVPPTSPDAINDEFDTYSGWSMYNLTSAAAMTDDGDGSIDPWTAPASGHFRRYNANSHLFLQFPNAAAAIIMYKSITIAANTLLWARWSSPMAMTSNTNTDEVNVSFGVWKDNGSGVPSSTDAIWVEHRNLSNAGRKIGWLEPSSVRNQANSVLSQGIPAPDIGALWIPTVGVSGGASTVFRPFFANSANGDVWHCTGNRTVTGASRVWLAFRFDITASSGICPVASVDFARRKVSATAWIV
jgi:hypothetical protein